MANVPLKRNINSNNVMWGRYPLGLAPSGLPLATKTDITSNYLGAFKVPDGAYGSGSIAFNPTTGTMFVDDNKANNFPVFEVNIPTLVQESSDLNLINTATILQSPVSLKSRIPSTEWGDYGQANSSNMWSMFHDGTYLYCSGIIGYDAAETGTDTTIRINDPTDLANTTVTGAFKVSNAQAASRWISPVPSAHQQNIGGAHLIGAGNGVSIVGRLSKGPSLFGLNITNLQTANDGATIPVAEHMNFKNSWIVDDYMNYGGATGGVNNDMYVTTSIPAYGFIIPGTRTYCVLGYSEGWNPSPLSYTQGNPDFEGYPTADPGSACSNPYVGTKTDGARDNGAICYKNGAGTWTDKRGQTQGGYFCWDNENRGPFYWMFDLDVILAAANPDDVLPYEYGPIEMPFSKPSVTIADGKADAIGAGAFDSANNILYLSLPYANNTGDENFTGNPVIVAYDLSGVGAQ